MIDAAGKFAARDGAAAKGLLERGGERGVEGERVAVDGGDDAFPEEVAGAGGPRDAAFGAPAGEVAHADLGDPRGGAGTADGDAGADGKGCGVGDAETLCADGDEGVGDGLTRRDGFSAFTTAADFNEGAARGGCRDEDGGGGVVFICALTGTAEDDAAGVEAKGAVDGVAAGCEEDGATKSVGADGECGNGVEGGLDTGAVVGCGKRGRSDGEFCGDEGDRLATARVAGVGEVDDGVAGAIGGVGEGAAFDLANRRRGARRKFRGNGERSGEKKECGEGAVHGSGMPNDPRRRCVPSARRGGYLPAA